MSEDPEDIRQNIRRLVRRSHSMDCDNHNLENVDDYQEHRLKFLEHRKRFEVPPPQPGKKHFIPDWVKPGCETGLPITYKRRGSEVSDIRIDTTDGEYATNRSGSGVRRAVSFTATTTPSRLKYQAAPKDPTVTKARNFSELRGLYEIPEPSEETRRNLTSAYDSRRSSINMDSVDSSTSSPVLRKTVKRALSYSPSSDYERRNGNTDTNFKIANLRTKFLQSLQERVTKATDSLKASTDDNNVYAENVDKLFLPADNHKNGKIDSSTVGKVEEPSHNINAAERLESRIPEATNRFVNPNILEFDEGLPPVDNTELTNHFERMGLQEEQKTSKLPTMNLNSIHDDKSKKLANEKDSPREKEVVANEELSRNTTTSSINSCTFRNSSKIHLRETIERSVEVKDTIYTISDDEDYEFQKRKEKLESLRKRLSGGMNFGNEKPKPHGEFNDQSRNKDSLREPARLNQHTYNYTKETLNRTDQCDMYSSNNSEPVNESKTITSESKKFESRTSIKMPTRIPVFNRSNTSSNLSRSNSARVPSKTVDQNVSRTKSFTTRRSINSLSSNKMVKPVIKKTVELKRYDHIMPDTMKTAKNESNLGTSERPTRAGSMGRHGILSLRRGRTPTRSLDRSEC